MDTAGNIVPDNSSNSFKVFPSTTSIGLIEFELNRDTNDTILLKNNLGPIQLTVTTNGVKITGLLELTKEDIYEYADDTAAGTGGLNTGMIQLLKLNYDLLMDQGLFCFLTFFI